VNPVTSGGVLPGKTSLFRVPSAPSCSSTHRAQTHRCVRRCRPRGAPAPDHDREQNRHFGLVIPVHQLVRDQSGFRGYGPWIGSIAFDPELACVASFAGEVADRKTPGGRIERGLEGISEPPPGRTIVRGQAATAARFEIWDFSLIPAFSRREKGNKFACGQPTLRLSKGPSRNNA
jgi:hypothetical protein